MKHLVDVSVPGETVEATYNHPFWVVEAQKFEWATDLKVGEHVLLASGKALPVVGLARHDEITTVYNLSIQQIHTFFVGDEPVLVHNSCIPQITPGSLPAEEEAAVNATLGHIQAGTQPTGALAKKWGTTFLNKEANLPGGALPRIPPPPPTRNSEWLPPLAPTVPVRGGSS